uniref:peptidylprolyl isomerase n=1 Tax=Ananas comosus var. bracteatus TaxID=296719 RepID=A0A6V7PLK5_ANACO|nr:unnamed protein product [Ananas comosus var. bracteatus]
MEVGALTSLSPIHHSSSIPRHVNKWKPKKLKIYCSGFSPDAFRQLSRRRLLSEFGALGAAISYTNSARSAPLQEAKDPDVIRYQKLSNGVKLQDILEGEGPAAHEGDFVEVNYVCRRSNGYFEHSTVDQFTGESRPVVLPLDEKEIIRGLKDVLIGMKVGGNILNLTIVPMARFHPLINTVKEHSADSCINKSNKVFDQFVIHSLVLGGAYYLTQKKLPAPPLASFFTRSLSGGISTAFSTSLSISLRRCGTLTLEDEDEVDEEEEEERLGADAGDEGVDGARERSGRGGGALRRVTSPGALAAAAAAAAARRRHLLRDLATEGKKNMPPWAARSRTRRSPLPKWYPRMPLRDITAIVRHAGWTLSNKHALGVAPSGTLGYWMINVRLRWCRLILLEWQRIWARNLSD